jgi:hypothetical protein
MKLLLLLTAISLNSFGQTPAPGTIDYRINRIPSITAGPSAIQSDAALVKADTTNARLLRILNKPTPVSGLPPNAATASNQVAANGLAQQLYDYLSQTQLTQAKGFFQNETGQFSLDGQQLYWSVVNVGDRVAKITDDLTGTTMDLEPGHTVSDQVFYRKDTNQLITPSPVTFDAGGSKLAIRWKNI